MAAGNTYEAIATTTLGSTATSVTFSSITGFYTDLVIVSVAGTVSSAPYITLNFNGDTASNYSGTVLSGSGTAVYSVRFTSETSLKTLYFGYPTSTTLAHNIINIMNYSNATTYKSVILRSGNADNGTNAIAGLYRSTSAITQVTINNADTFTVGSTFSLYGIKAA